MKKRQAKKILKRWTPQRHATLRRAVWVFSAQTSWGAGDEVACARRWIRLSATPGAYQLSLWLLRLSDAREISRLHSREPRQDVAEMWAWAHQTEGLYLARRRDATGAPRRGASLTLGAVSVTLC